MPRRGRAMSGASAAHRTQEAVHEDAQDVHSDRHFDSRGLRLIGCGAASARGSESPRAGSLLRRNPRAHELVVRRVRLRQHQDRAGRRLQVRHGSAHRPSGRLQGEDQPSARFHGGDRSCRVCGHRSAGKRPEFGDRQIAHCRKAEDPKQGGHSARVPVSGDVPSAAADPGASEPRGRGYRLEAGRRQCGQVLPAGKVHDLPGV